MPKMQPWEELEARDVQRPRGENNLGGLRNRRSQCEMRCWEGTRRRLGQASWCGEAWNFIPVSQEAGEGPGGAAASGAGNAGGHAVH